MELEEIKQYLEENQESEDVQEYLSGFKSEITPDVVSNWLDTDDGMAFIDPKFDKRISQAISTYKEGHYKDEVETLVESELRRRTPKETEDQIRIRKVEKELEDQKQRTARAERSKVAIEYANKKDLKMGDLLGRFVGETDEQTRDNIDQMVDYQNLWKQQGVNKVMADHSIVPEGSNENSDPVLGSYAAIKEFVGTRGYEKNKDLIDRSLERLKKK